jgi:glycine/D-amino acid oxidase-like deaminating enzyme
MKEHLAGKHVAVLGAGMVGLATANRLIELAEEESSSIQIHVLHERALQETTSDGAGGLFEPDDLTVHASGGDAVKRQWMVDSFNYYHRMLMSADGGKMGFFKFSGHLLFEKNEREKVKL